MTAHVLPPISLSGKQHEDGIWRAFRLVARRQARLRPALFLDRDGVINADYGYTYRLAELDILPGAVNLVCMANARDVPVVVVTNQSGIGRGYYDWRAFAAFQTAIETQLADAGGWLDAALACPFHEDAIPPYDIADHPARKPNPGMFLDAADALDLDLGTSWIIGDRPGDLLAGCKAGLAGGLMIGDDPLLPSLPAAFTARIVASTAEVPDVLPLFRNA